MSERLCLEHYLNPGELYFGQGQVRVATLLGSCVAITLWHPKARHGGICHFVLDSRGGALDSLDGRYADEAVAMFLVELGLRGTRPAEYEVKVFGGANMFTNDGTDIGNLDVGARNIAAADRLLASHGFPNAKARHVGGTGHRRLLFELWNGDVWMRYKRP